MNIKEVTDDDLMSNAIRFAFNKCPEDERGALVDFQRYKITFYNCAKWLRDNYETVDPDFGEMVVIESN